MLFVERSAWFRSRPSHGSFRASALLQFGYRSRRDRTAGLSPRGFSPHVLDKKKSSFEKLLFLAEDMGLEPTGLLHLTRIPSELLSHSVNPPNVCFLLSLRATCINLTQMVVGCKWNL